MRGITSNDKSELDAINKKINDWMIANIQNYNAEKWGDVIEHPTLKGTWILIINDDSRNATDRLSEVEKTRCIEHDAEERRKA